MPLCYAAHGKGALILYSWMNSFVFLKGFSAYSSQWDQWEMCLQKTFEHSMKRERLLGNMNGAWDN